jgi:type I restriction enzyme S subunit
VSDEALPKSWAYSPIGGCCDLNPKLDKSQFDDAQEVHFVPMPAVEALTNKIDISATRAFGEVRKGYTPFTGGDVIFAKITPCMENGKTAVVPYLPHGLAFGSTEFHVVRPCGDLEPLWFFYFLSSRSFRSNAEHNMTGAVGQRRVPIDFIASSPIPLPPLAEQKRIVAKIEELFSELQAGEESLRLARRQLATYRQSLLKQAFEGKLTQTWRTQNPDKLDSVETSPAVEGSHALPDGWRWIKLGSAIEEPAYGTSKKCSYESTGLGVLRIPNVVNGTIDAGDLKFAEFTDDERKSYEIRAGDLLLIRSNGSVSIVGRCAIVEPKHTEFLYAGYLIRLRPRAPLLNSRFLRDQMSSHRLRSQIEFSAKSTSGVNNINSKEIQRLLIALPSLPEQREIVRLLNEQFEAIERNERELDAALQRSEALRQAILKKAFTGRLVPQDPADQPATELLARLQEERAASTRLVRKKTRP